MPAPIRPATSVPATRPVYGPPAPVEAAPARERERTSFGADRFASTRTEHPEDRQRRLLREMVETDAYSSRPSTMGPHRHRNPYKKPSGVRVGTDLGDGWRLEGIASPRRGGTAMVGLRAKF